MTGFDENGKEILQKLNQVEEAFDRKRFCYELKIKGLLCEAFAMILYGHRQELTKFVPANLHNVSLAVALGHTDGSRRSLVSNINAAQVVSSSGQAQEVSDIIANAIAGGFVSTILTPN